MLYIISVSNDANKKALHYMGFETISSSLFKIYPKELKSIIQNTNLKVVNATIHNNGHIAIKDWPNNIYSEGHGIRAEERGSNYVLLAKRKTTFKVVDNGRIYDMDKGALTRLIKANKVANCGINKLKDELILLDYYTIKEDETFEKEIGSKYNAFLVKAGALGYGNISFEYTIENREITYTKYTGSSETVIIPSFVTAIKRYAFSRTPFKRIKLSEGLKIIGDDAFYPGPTSNGLTNIEIPSTVEIIGDDAFSKNYNLRKLNGTMDMSKVKLLSSKTVLLGQEV